MATVIVIANQKGGVGKTTTAAAMGAGLLLKGHRALLIDADPQADLSFTLAAATAGATLKEVLEGNITAAEAVQHTASGDIISSKPELAGADKWLKRAEVLKERLAGIQEQYDFIIIDTPRALAMLTINAFTAADEIIITATADPYCLNATLQLNETIKAVRAMSNKKLTVAGVLLCRQETIRANINKELEAVLRRKISQQIGCKVFSASIRNGKHIREAVLMQESIFSYAPESNPGIDYMAFVEEYLAERPHSSI